MSNDTTQVAGEALEDERAWRRHEIRMYFIMGLFICLVVAVIGVVLGSTMNKAGEDRVLPAVQAVDVDVNRR
jgi:t-SNARE complex subunit (syntaxin)